MTFNIRYGTADDHEDRWENRRDMFFQLLRDQHPDILSLQEALRFQIDEIHKALLGYGEIGVGRDDGKTRGEYSAILYLKSRFDPGEKGTFWFSDTPERPGSITWGNACTRICSWGRLHDSQTGRHFYVFNLHLDHVSQPSREKSVALLFDRIQHRIHDDPVLVTGDFNAGEDNPAVLRMIAAPSSQSVRDQSAAAPHFIDTFRARHPDAKDVATFHAFKGSRHADKIDYIFAPQGTLVLDAAILHESRNGHYPSDHFPVTAVVQLR